MDPNELAEQNFRLVKHFATRYIGTGLEYEDLLSIGSYALCRAAKKFDASLGFKFATLADKYMKNELLKELARNKQWTLVKKIGSILSLDGLIQDINDAPVTLLDTIGGSDHGYELVELGDVLPFTDIRWLKIKILYHVHGYTQREIAKLLGIGQMTVSRELNKTLDQATSMPGMDDRVG